MTVNMVGKKEKKKKEKKDVKGESIVFGDWIFGDEKYQALRLKLG